MPSFVEIGKAEVTKPVPGIHEEKRLVFGSFLWAPGAISPKILCGHSFPIPDPSVKFRQNLSSL